MHIYEIQGSKGLNVVGNLKAGIPSGRSRLGNLAEKLMVEAYFWEGYTRES